MFLDCFSINHIRQIFYVGGAIAPLPDTLHHSIIQADPENICTDLCPQPQLEKKTDNIINKKNSFPMLVSRCCLISPFRGCPECSSGCCFAPDRRRLPPTTSSYHWKISNTYPHIASSLPGTGTELKTGMKYTVTLTKTHTKEITIKYLICTFS